MGFFMGQGLHTNGRGGSAPPKFAPHTCGHCGLTRETLNGAWLRWHRERAGIGLRELSRRCGLSAAFLSDVERGNRHATPRVEAAYSTLTASVNV